MAFLLIPFIRASLSPRQKPETLPIEMHWRGSRGIGIGLMSVSAITLLIGALLLLVVAQGDLGVSISVMQKLQVGLLFFIMGPLFAYWGITQFRCRNDIVISDKSVKYFRQEKLGKESWEEALENYEGLLQHHFKISSIITSRIFWRNYIGIVLKHKNDWHKNILFIGYSTSWRAEKNNADFIDQDAMIAQLASLLKMPILSPTEDSTSRFSEQSNGNIISDLKSTFNIRPTTC